ncbi:phosphate signaling complex protein PhoU [Ramlibacter sp. G-1-2-2]|uniref:Phosphate signaling complex protein PhoU n=1 Tax=Ramlibacter agri TaxID=2728837 RepID=A0A848HDA9_9BURK|nr:phosphate signaling complex protein PhoU [Ramlibacter agri]NML47459.1 phosphate signaling complex protein PhoU [Ramlibacter agri]
MADQHIASRFDRNINVLVLRVMALGGLVEKQARDATRALMAVDVPGAQEVLATEWLVDRLEVEIDRDLSSACGRRQPKASELRLLTAMARATSHLERAGDEAERIARAVQSIARHPTELANLLPADLETAATLAASQLRRALDALVRLDTADALAVIADDRMLDREFARCLATLATRMALRPRSVAPGVDLVMAAKAIERIGHHARNIAECIIYIVQGAEMRHGTVTEPTCRADKLGADATVRHERHQDRTPVHREPT